LKKIIVVLVALLLLSSCLPSTPPPPYGVWVSEEPRIVLFLTSEYRIFEGPSIYLGIYSIDDVDTKVSAQFGNGLWIEIYGLTEQRTQWGGIIHSDMLLAGSYQLVRDEIHYRITSHFQEQLGIDTIILQRIENYKPIDPEWLANFIADLAQEGPTSTEEE
jgi:hypothetical protein